MYVRRLLPFEIRPTFNPATLETPIYRSLTNRTEQTNMDTRTHTRASTNQLERLEYYLELREFYLPRRRRTNIVATTRRTNERTIVRSLVFSNRDFTSTLYSGMRASCATSADLRRPLPHYLVHAPRSLEMPRRRNSIERSASSVPGLPPRRRLSPVFRQISSRSCLFPVDSSPRRVSRLRVFNSPYLS